jgi:hypothetical protein
MFFFGWSGNFCGCVWLYLCIYTKHEKANFLFFTCLLKLGWIGVYLMLEDSAVAPRCDECVGREKRRVGKGRRTCMIYVLVKLCLLYMQLYRCSESEKRLRDIYRVRCQ